MLLSGRAAEHVVFGRISTGAANDLERVTAIARAMVFEYGMGESVTSRTMRADNYALSEETKRLRDAEQARIADEAYIDAIALCEEWRDALERLATALLDRETLDRIEVKRLFVRRADPLELRHDGRRGPDAAARHRRSSRNYGRGRRRGLGRGLLVLAERRDLRLLGVDCGLGVADGLRLGGEGVGRQRAGLGRLERLAPVGGERVFELRLELLQLELQLLAPWRAPGPSRGRRSRAPCPSRARPSPCRGIPFRASLRCSSAALSHPRAIAAAYHDQP